MENQDKFNEIAYKKAQKRVKDIRTYYYMVLGYLAVGYYIVSRNYDGNLLNISRNYSVWIVILWGIFLLGYGIYLFTPYFRNWEERKTKELMEKYKQKN